MQRNENLIKEIEGDPVVDKVFDALEKAGLKGLAYIFISLLVKAAFSEHPVPKVEDSLNAMNGIGLAMINATMDYITKNPELSALAAKILKKDVSAHKEEKDVEKKVKNQNPEENINVFFNLAYREIYGFDRLTDTQKDDYSDLK